MYLIAHIERTAKNNEHVCWWKPDRRGYTICIDKAGEYNEEEARSICGHTTVCIAVPKQDAAVVSRSTPYYRRSNGDLVPLYDGKDHRPVPNTRDAWVHLLAKALRCGPHEKPTPIGAKARAIYLPTAEQLETPHD